MTTPNKLGTTAESAVFFDEGGDVIAFARAKSMAPRRKGTGASDCTRHVADLFKDHHDRLVRFLSIRFGSDAEAQEVAQEAYIRLLQIDGLMRSDNLQALLYVTARNIAIDRFRRRDLQISYEREHGRLECDVLTPERIVSDRQRLQRVRKLIGELSPKCQYAFIGYKFHGMAYEEIALKMGLTESMVRKYVLRAIAYCASNLARRDMP